MPLDLTPLDSASRLLVEAELKVATGGGGRFQPTGFPDLGPALYRGADGADWLLVESPQSMANRLELACWDEGAECFDTVCNGIPFIRSVVTASNETSTTSTVQESHRLASPYILAGTLTTGAETQQLWKVLKSTTHASGLGLQENRPFLLRNHASRLLALDPSSLLHGVWLSTKVEGTGRQKKAICGGKIRFPRLLSAYIEAEDPQQVNWGGVKRERIFDQAESGTTDAESGFGSIPFPRTDFTAPKVRAFFSLDLQLLRTLALGERQERLDDGTTTRIPRSRALNERQGNFTNEEAFLICWSLYKIERFLSHGLTLRSNCQFARGTLRIEAPERFVWPTNLTADLGTLRNQLFPIRAEEQDQWRRRNVLTVTWAGTAPVPIAADQTPDTSNDQDQAAPGSAI